MPIKPKNIEMFYMDNTPDVSALFVARDGKGNILAEYEHKNTKNIEATKKVYDQALKSKSHADKFWNLWNDNVKKNKI